VKNYGRRSSPILAASDCSDRGQHGKCATFRNAQALAVSTRRELQIFSRSRQRWDQKEQKEWSAAYPGRKTTGMVLEADGGTHWLGSVIPSMIMKQRVWLTVTFWVSLQTSVA